MNTFAGLLRAGMRIARSTLNSDLQSANWGLMHGFTLKLLKASVNETANIPIEFIQAASSMCKYMPWPGLKINRMTIPDKYRDEAYNWMKKYFEAKYGHYPIPKNHHWSLSGPLEAQWIKPTGREAIKDQPVVYYVHGGGYVLGHSCLYNHTYRDLTEASTSNVFSIDYRLGPQFTLPSMVEDVLAGYLYMISQNSNRKDNINSNRVLMAGESAGGGLILNLLHSIRNSNIPIPGGSLLISPVTDLTLSQPSFFTNNKLDYLWSMKEPVTLTSKGLNIQSALYYSILKYGSKEVLDRFKKDGTPFGPKEALFWPEFSPLHDPDMSNLPPTMIIVGDRDSFRDSGIVYGKLRAESEIKSGKKTIIPNIQTYVFEDMVHAFPLLGTNQYCKKAIQTSSEFIYQAVNANDQQALDSKSYREIPDYKQSYLKSACNMYWNTIQNQYIPWNSTYPIVDLPTLKMLQNPGKDFFLSP
ncbi:alpha/beta-hydrolase [Conidiobolus coronatus NRRL 28638]|uniref:Alpha/beta-hydrolase n=1 Tax=Conidiobolus coronatus (strain ATCC 28846 / CBS 209.66 / NRRL 28638) TaxID=796925 RepID=A0A137NXH6_CONC2|nr:alpha/beta-hydrolase [Conidiobolus coronatus NRRL 28638]|eukprot:KXN67553.1 alpha/beta-hydrolase [Conidiobolus coronatus NRRL 28638]